MNQNPDVSTRTSRFIARWIAFCERHAIALVALFVVAAGLAAIPASHLELHTDLAELLPDQHPGVVALRTVGPRQVTSSNLVLIVDSPDRAKNRAFIEALRPSLEALVPSTFTEISWHPETETGEYAAKQKWLYASLEDLHSAESFLDRLIARRTNPLFVDLEGDPEQHLKELREKLNQKLPAVDWSPYFEHQGTPDNKKEWLLGVMLWRRGGGLAAVGDAELVHMVDELVKKIDPSKFDPKMTVQFTGHIARALETQEGVRSDLSTSSTVCVILVLLIIWLYFRRVAVVLSVFAPALMGLLFALALARFTIHFINANTAFLISIILGNGINAPIIVFARYGEERRAGRTVGESLSRAMYITLPAVLTAMAAASVAYGSLLVTSLRGFNQFGLVGGSGMLLVWLMTIFFLPPLVIVGERIRPGLLTPKPTWWRGPFRMLGRVVERAPLVVALLVLAGTAAAVAPAVRYARDPLEYNFDKLGDDDPGVNRKWDAMYDLGMGNVGAGYIARDGVILVDKAEQADPVADAILAQDKAFGSKSVIEGVHTLNRALPTDQDAKLAILSHIRARIDKNKRLMDDDEKREVQAWRPPDYLHKLTVAELPRRVRENFTEVDGTVGRFVGIDADPNRYVMGDGRELIRLSHSLQVEALGKRWVAAASSTVFAGMLDTIMQDGPKLLITAMVGVTVLILIGFGVRGSLWVLGPLAIGVTWLVALCGLFAIKLNFLNFVAVPITLGIGTDYAANLWVRLSRERGTPVREVVADTGSAVALCSMTTIIGYSSLLLARNRALQSFGKVADLGEVTCLLAALVALPSVVWLLRRRERVAPEAQRKAA